MRTVCWSVKGGSGTTTVAVAMAVLAARTGEGPVTLVDLAGDVVPLLGLANVGPGVQDWFISAPSVGGEALDHLLLGAADNVVVLPGRLAMEPRADRIADLDAWLNTRPGPVIVDLGSVTSRSPLLDSLLGGSARSLLVTRPCYLSLLRASSASYRPTGVVLVREPERGLDASDVEAAVGAPVVATLDVHPSVARAVDSGTLATRLPRSLRRSLATAA